MKYYHKVEDVEDIMTPAKEKSLEDLQNQIINNLQSNTQIVI